MATERQVCGLEGRIEALELLAERLARRLTLSGNAPYVCAAYMAACLEPPALATREATGKD